MVSISLNADEAQTILVVEDDPSLSVWIAEYLNAQQYAVTVASNGVDAIRMIREDQPDLVLLDVNLPGKDGFEVCKSVRPFYTGPILMMTARLDEMDEVVGLELGADDYVTKPIRPRALLARIKTLMQRAPARPPSDADPRSVLTFGALSIHANARRVTLADNPVRISSNEFDVLYYLAARAGKIILREDLLRDIRGLEYDGFDRSMDVLVSRVRKKIQIPGQPDRIQTVWGKGYLFTQEASS